MLYYALYDFLDFPIDASKIGDARAFVIDTKPLLQYLNKVLNAAFEHVSSTSPIVSAEIKVALMLDQCLKQACKNCRELNKNQLVNFILASYVILSIFEISVRLARHERIMGSLLKLFELLLENRNFNAINDALLEIAHILNVSLNRLSNYLGKIDVSNVNRPLIRLIRTYAIDSDMRYGSGYKHYDPLINRFNKIMAHISILSQRRKLEYILEGKMSSRNYYSFFIPFMKPSISKKDYGMCQVPSTTLNTPLLSAWSSSLVQKHDASDKRYTYGTFST